MSEPVFEVDEDKTEELRWRMKGDNNEIIASSEGYRKKAGCEDRIAIAKKNSLIAEIVEKQNISAREEPMTMVSLRQDGLPVYHGAIRIHC